MPLRQGKGLPEGVLWKEWSPLKGKLVRKRGCLNGISGCWAESEVPLVLGFCESPQSACFKHSWWKTYCPRGHKNGSVQRRGRTNGDPHVWATSSSSQKKVIYRTDFTEDLGQGHDFVWLTTRRTTKTVVATLQGRLWWCFPPQSVEEMRTGGLLYSCTRQFAHWCLWVGEGCDGKCERWKAGTRKEPFIKQRHNPTMPFSACAHNKEHSEAHFLQPHSPLWTWCPVSLLGLSII